MFNFLGGKQRECPYCRIKLEIVPKGKFKCPSCKQEIYFQKLGDKTKLITKSDYESLQIQKKKKTEENKYYSFFDSRGMTRSYLEKRRNDYFDKFKEQANYPDLIWSLSNQLLYEFSKKNDYSEMKMLYHKMAYFQKKNKKEFFHLMQQSRKMELYAIRKEYRGSTYKVAVMCGENDCQACKELDGKMFTLKEALEKMPIPPNNCTNDGGWCSCCYTIEEVDE